jgi:hypothetical protein
MGHFRPKIVHKSVVQLIGFGGQLGKVFQNFILVVRIQITDMDAVRQEYLIARN